MTKKKSEFKPNGGVDLKVDFSDLKKLVEELFAPKEEEWAITIKRKNNGYSLKGTDNFEEVIEDKSDDDLYSHENLLWSIMEFFNFMGSKHDPERLRIIREKREED